MAKTADQVLREFVAEQIFQIVQLVAQVEKLTEEIQKLTPPASDKKPTSEST
jgi:uncharacterized coiled-coil protein SlyX